MYEKDEFQSIEAQLADEAQLLINTKPMKLVLADLCQEFSVRRENRRQASALLAIAVVMCVGVVSINSFSSVNDPELVSSSGGQSDSQSEEDLQSLEVSANEVVGLDQIQGQRFVLVFSREAEDGQSESAFGIYVPEQVKDIDLEELTAAQRYGVSEVLGSEMSFNNDRSI